MTLLWVYQWFGIANVSRKLKPRVTKCFTERFLKKCCKNAVKMPFSHVAPTKHVALTLNFIWTIQIGWGMYIPNFKSLRHLEVRQYAAKCCKNAFFVHGSHENRSIFLKLYMDKPKHVYCLHTKFQIFSSTQSLSICCRML